MTEDDDMGELHEFPRSPHDWSYGIDAEVMDCAAALSRLVNLLHEIEQPHQVGVAYALVCACLRDPKSVHQWIERQIRLAEEHST